MEDKKDMIIFKESLFKRVLNKIKGIFGIKKEAGNIPEKVVPINKFKESSEKQKNDFINSIKVEEDSGIIYLKLKLENREIRAIDLTDEQIDELQEIYDKEIREKKEKIRRLKSA